MTKQNTKESSAGCSRATWPRLIWSGLNLWSLVPIVITLVVVAPMFAVIWLALHPTENIWPHLSATVLPRYLKNTLILMLGVGILAAAVGTGSAWLVVMYRFPGRRWLEHALLFPLASPAYIGAYALVDFLTYSGPVQTGLRLAMGWTSARDYAFPDVHSVSFAVIVLASALYPYVYLLARAAFREQSGSSYEVARALGVGPWGVFWRVGLPLARPAIAAGVALVLMETIADFGTVQYFGVQTLTTGVFSTWLNDNNAGGAAQIALVILALVLGLLWIERQSRKRARFHVMARAARPVVPQDLARPWAWIATVFCVVPLAMGFLLPVAVMAGHALRHPQAWIEPGLGKAVVDTVFIGGLSAVLTVATAVLLVYGLRQTGRWLTRLVLPLTALGYAAPGAVMAVGILMPLAALDHHLADAVLSLTGHDPGLMLTGTVAALILAYMVRFFGIAQGVVDSAFGRVAPSLPMAARSLGKTRGQTLNSVYLPLMNRSVSTALLLVFVDCVKELPATLLLRPFNLNTLATRAYDLASLEKIGEAAPAALMVIAISLAAVAAMSRQNSD
ncbi:MAG: iron ABC transporter permease [Alphaproteobacteria bacterium]